MFSSLLNSELDNTFDQAIKGLNVIQVLQIFLSYILDNTKKPFKQKTLYSKEKGENCIKQLHINIKIENVSFQFHPSYLTLRNKLKVYKHQSLETEGDNVVLPEEMPLQPEDSCDTDFRPR